MTAVGINSSNSNEIAVVLVQEAETQIRRCMVDKGFPYEPHVVADDVGDGWLPNVSRADFASRYGFGSRLDPTLDGAVEGIVATDPNAEYLQSLSEPDYDAWNEALAGPDGTSGCRGEAQDGIADGAIKIVQPIISNANTEVASHPDVVAARSRYVECTTAEGIPWMNNPDGARLIGAQYAQTNSLSEADEVSAATAELGCRYDYVVVERNVRWTVESRIVDENADSLATARASISNL